MMTRRRLLRTSGRSLLILSVVVPLLGGSCRRDSDQPPAKDREARPERHAGDLLVFPERLHVEDAAVNEFVEHAMAVCAAGDYEKFRLLWSAGHDPLPRDEYEQGWQAVQRIEMRALELVILASGSRGEPPRGENAYVVLAEVNLDPAHPAAEHEPRREVVMMLVHEQGAWRLADAPRGLRTWVKDKVGATGQPPADASDASRRPATGG